MDLETSPIVGYSWGLVEACNNQTELSLLKKLHKLMDEADVIVAHNGDAFDIKNINSRFIIYQISPPSPYRTIDTLKEARKIAAFDSNSLNNLGIDMGEGEKIKHRGFDMWEGCMAGNKKDWADMKKYNKRDVDLLAKVYIRLRPWMKTHPDIRHDYDEKCPKCNSENTERRGRRRTLKNFYYRMQCMGCGGWFRGDRI